MSEEREIYPLLESESISYCMNPKCSQRRNPDDAEQCQTCGTPLLLADRYRLVRPMRELSDAFPTEIFEVEDWDLDAEDAERPKVVKILNRYDRQILELFEREARVLISLDIPGLPRVRANGYFTVELERGNKLHCLVMEQIEGENLLDWLKQNGSIDEELAIAWLRQLTRLLGYVHEKGLLHRDIKPANIVRRLNGELALIDFGSVGFIDRAVTPVGSYGYTAPEQVNGQAVPQSDFFALGSTIVHLLTGEHPYDELPKNEFGQLIWRDRVPGVSQSFADLIDEAISPFPQERPANTQVILERLDRIEAGDITLPPKPGFPWWPIWNKRQMVAIALLFSIGFVGLRLSLPPVSELFNYLGQKSRHDRFSDKAEFWYEWAIRIHRDNAKVYYNLGSLYEGRPVPDNAKAGEYYKTAAEKGFSPAHNNLGRLEIIAKNYPEAVHLLLAGLELAREDGVKYSLNKNLGWARLEQGRLEQAEARLRMAIALDSQKGAAYCLLAQVLEAGGDDSGALKHWENCIAYASYRQSPEEDRWIDMGQKRLTQQERVFQDFRTRRITRMPQLRRPPAFFWRQVCEEDSVEPKNKAGSKLVEAKQAWEMGQT
ncbi:MAG: protein kinase [Oscillatoria sp. SIO1A7]|nr:protein kinase [Oscillatoria sp. SIO1A7]